jgi:maleate cis-trans isomerase
MKIQTKAKKLAVTASMAVAASLQMIVVQFMHFMQPHHLDVNHRAMQHHLFDVLTKDIN